mmetsp:Transcript_31979/g.77772  ORF Transcript_31979/g.77772 Transcript_31979/m.77772 type:complete len:204 (+) Transcript_31979:1714-2325(+)
MASTSGPTDTVELDFFSFRNEGYRIGVFGFRDDRVFDRKTCAGVQSTFQVLRHFNSKSSPDKHTVRIIVPDANSFLVTALGGWWDGLESRRACSLRQIRAQVVACDNRWVEGIGVAIDPGIFNSFQSLDYFNFRLAVSRTHVTFQTGVEVLLGKVACFQKVSKCFSVSKQVIDAIKLLTFLRVHITRPYVITLVEVVLTLKKV